MELFGAPSKGKTKEAVKQEVVKSKEAEKETAPTSVVETKATYSFADAGLCEWLCKSTYAMGFRKPTDIQKECIPAILSGRDVLACAETGSGKTAAFALPILQKLSEDPYGIYAIILTPTRELAIQISEQVVSLGASFGVRISLVIGGVNLIEQSISLSKRPHIVIATPGRLRHHLTSADPPDISKAQFIVLDEADRLISKGFSSELQIIFDKMSPKRKTLLFSATLTSSLEALEKLALNNALRFDLTKEQKVPERLLQQYLFMPARIKTCYLYAVLKKLVPEEELHSGGGGGGGPKPSKKGKGKNRRQHHNVKTDDIDTDALLAAYAEKMKAKEEAATKNGPSVSSIMIFVGKCKRCQEVTDVLTNLGISCVSLHGMMEQRLRIEALGKFKNQLVRILVATDVASRGLDIPSVDLVINFDLPKITSDYIHRVGRTARAGRSGRALSFVTQYDVEMVHAIEAYTEQMMVLSTEVSEEDVVPLLNEVSGAMRETQMKMLDEKGEEKMEVIRKRKRQQKKALLRQGRSEGGENDADSDEE